MFKKCYVIYDKVAKESGEFMLLNNDEVASRIFINTLKKEIANGCKPNDYELVCIGKFDSEKHTLYTSDMIINEDGTKEFKELNYTVPVSINGDDE